ncbi:MAG: alpha/beta hydrolase, partial [Acidimicrobiia bacterium]|nr:alpha/beta hydrolase [Acidimicrobiia bacterium]
MVIDGIEALGIATLTEGTDPDVIRGLMNAMVLPSTIELPRVENAAVPGPAGDIPIRLYRPEGAASKPVVVFFHGGGWVLGSLETHDATCRALAKEIDAVIVSVDYRLAPEHRFPAAVEDAYAALSWVHAHADELGGDPARLVVAGDSAGGNLAAVMAQLARESGPALAAQLLIYPVTDHEFTSRSMEDNAEGYFLTRDAMRWFYANYLTTAAEGDDARVSPLRAPDLSGLPPAIVLTMEYDPL